MFNLTVINRCSIKYYIFLWDCEYASKLTELFPETDPEYHQR